MYQIQSEPNTLFINNIKKNSFVIVHFFLLVIKIKFKTYNLKEKS